MAIPRYSQLIQQLYTILHYSTITIQSTFVLDVYVYVYESVQSVTTRRQPRTPMTSLPGGHVIGQQRGADLLAVRLHLTAWFDPDSVAVHCRVTRSLALVSSQLSQVALTMTDSVLAMCYACFPSIRSVRKARFP